MNEKLKKLLRQAGWDPAECETDGKYLGSTNASFSCIYRGRTYICRLATKSSDILAIDRNAEYAVLKMMSDLGCGAPLVYFDSETGNMITEYIRGRDVNGADYGDPDFIKRTVGLMKKMHGKKTDYVFDPFRDIERKTAYIKEQNIPLHERFDDVYERFLKIKSRYPKEQSSYIGLCHGDPFANNFILSDDGKLYLIDYEFAGMCDVFFDISCIINWFPRENKEYFLTEYFGYCDGAMLDRVCDFNFIQILWNGTWSYVKSRDPGANDFDYVNFGHHHINMLTDS